MDQSEEVEEEEDNYERCECDFMREFLTNYVNETFKEFGVSTAQIEGETTEEIWENMHKKMEELIDEIGENEYKVEEAKVDRYLEEALDHFMETGLLPGQSVPL